jgi:hypothetical protein
MRLYALRHKTHKKMTEMKSTPNDFDFKNISSNVLLVIGILSKSSVIFFGLKSKIQ